MAERDLLAWAEQFENLANQLCEEWRVRELRVISMTPEELQEAGVKDWNAKFIKQYVVPRYRAAGAILEDAWRNGEFSDDGYFRGIIHNAQTTERDDKRLTDIFHQLWHGWLPRMNEPGTPKEAKPVVEAYATAIRSFARVFRRHGQTIQRTASAKTIEPAIETVPTVAMSKEQKRASRDKQIKLLCNTHKLRGKWAALEERAKADPIIEQLGLKVTRYIVRNVIEPPHLRRKK